LRSGYDLLEGYKSHDLFNGDMFERGADCGRWTPNTGSAEYDTPASESLVFHKAWTVSWNKTDTETLTPQLPTLTNGMKVPTWTPGEEIPDGKYDDKEHAANRPFLSIIVSVTVVSFVLIVACIGLKCRRVKERRKRRMTKAAQQESL